METMEQLKLKTVFDYYSGNDHIIDLIYKIGKKTGINGFVERKKDTVYIYVSGSHKDIEKFYSELGEKLPYSIFMSEAKTYPVENFEEEDRPFHIKGDINILPKSLSPCPTCTKELFDISNRRFYFPFISCNYCGSHYSYLYEYPFEREKTVFKFFKMCKDCEKEFNDKNSFRYKYPLTACHNCLTPIYLKKGENERYGFDNEKTVGAIRTAAGVIKKGNLLRIYTSLGEMVAGIATEENISKVRQFLGLGEKPLNLLITNPQNLSKYFHIDQPELKALASQEKPVVLLPFKELPEKELLFPDLGYGKIKFPDEPLLLLLANHLKEEEIDYIFYAYITDEFQKAITDFELNADLPVINRQKETEVVLINGEIFVKEGEKGILPEIIKAKPTDNLAITEDYIALDLGNGEYLVDKKEKLIYQLKDFVDEINSLTILEGIEENIDIPYKKKKTFKKYEGAILSVLAENNKLSEKALCFYFSSYSNEDMIAIYKNKTVNPLIKVLPIRVYDNLKDTALWVLEKIEKSSEEAKRLIDRWREKFPQFSGEISSQSYQEKSSITAVFNVISYLLGIFNKEPSYFDQPYQALLKEALSFEAKRGLRIDYFLEEIDEEFYLDWRKIIHSTLSFKLADTDNKMLAFSVIEGFKEWIEKEGSSILYKLKLNNVVIVGDIFTNPVLIGKLLPHFSGKYNLLRNKRLPLDRQNLVLGGVFI